MSLENHYVYVDNDTHQLIHLYLPSFYGKPINLDYTTGGAFYRESLQQISVDCNNEFDFSTTCFVATTEQKNKAIRVGVPEPYIIDLSNYIGHTWEKVGNSSHTIYIPDGRVISYRINDVEIYNQDVTFNSWMVTPFSLEPVTGDGRGGLSPVHWDNDLGCELYTIDVWYDKLQIAPINGSIPNTKGDNSKIMDYWNGLNPNPTVPAVPVSIPVQWKSTRYGKTYQDSYNINVFKESQ